MFFIFTLTNTKGRLSNEKHPLNFVLLKKTYDTSSFTSAAKFFGSNLIPGPIVVDR